MAKLLNRQTCCRVLTINPFYKGTQSKSAPAAKMHHTTHMARILKYLALWVVVTGLPGVALPLAAAELLGGGTTLSRADGAVVLTLHLSAPIPFKTYTLDNPRRLVVDLGDTALAAMPPGLAGAVPEVSALRYGLFQIGQARIVLDLAAPMVIDSALATDGARRIHIRLRPASGPEFAAAARTAPAALWRPAQLSPDIRGQAGLPLIAIDPGHGGPDHGAERGGVAEKDIVLQVAKRLRDVLLAGGDFRVLLTRDRDIFIPLGERVEIARRAGARAFISLHADVVTRGRARGTTVFSLSEASDSQQALTIATLENRADLVAGISVQGEDDQLARVLLQLAHRQTDALSRRFADTLAEALWFQNDSEIKSRRMAAGFRVLRAPDIPSVLVELGFMTDKADLKNLQDPDWQRAMAESLQSGLRRWLRVEKTMRGLLRN